MSTLAYGRDGAVKCRHCQRTATAGNPGDLPHGWYGLTVAVPRERTRNGRGLIWVGVFCCMACLLAHGPVMAEQEFAARQTYDAVAPA